MSKSSYILLADYAKSAGLSLEEARELIYEDNSEYLVSSIDDVLDLKTDQITW